MLLPADLHSYLLDKIIFEIEIHLFEFRRNFKRRPGSHRRHLLSDFQNFGGNLFFDDTLLGKHQNMGFVDINITLIRTFNFFPSQCRRHHNVRYFFCGRFLKTTAFDLLSHILISSKMHHHIESFREGFI